MSPHKLVPRKGTTLVELSVVIVVILAFVTALFFGATYYRNSANQANCISQLSQIQKSLRAYQNLENLSTGDPIDASAIVGEGKPIPAPIFCPTAGGAYTFADFVPASGDPFVFCSEYDSTFGSEDPTQAHTPPADNFQ